MKKTLLTILAIGLGWAPSVLGVEFSADVIMEAGGIRDSGKVYFKSPQVTRNEIMGLVTIVNEGKVYQLYPASQKYIVTGIEDITRQNTMVGVKDIKAFFEENRMKRAGRENIGALACDIYEGELTYEEGQPPALTKIWYAIELDYPVKQEMTMPPPQGKMVFRLDNIRKGRQAADLFKVPAGYTRVAGPADAMGFQMPEIRDGMPSQEEIMQQMQEMMKNMPSH